MLLKQLGLVRIGLLVLSILCYPMVFFADMKPEGIGIFTAYITPSVTVMLIFVLALDALMNRVFMIEREPEITAMHRTRMRADLLVLAGLIGFWFPYFRSIGAL